MKSFEVLNFLSQLLGSQKELNHLKRVKTSIKAKVQDSAC